jgi:hypothetical protein
MASNPIEAGSSVFDRLVSATNATTTAFNFAASKTYNVAIAVDEKIMPSNKYARAMVYGGVVVAVAAPVALPVLGEGIAVINIRGRYVPGKDMGYQYVEIVV